MKNKAEQSDFQRFLRQEWTAKKLLLVIPAFVAFALLFVTLLGFRAKDAMFGAPAPR